MKKIASWFLMNLGRSLPSLPKVHAVANRLLWPMHEKLRLGGGVVDVLGLKMELDPAECVDRNLWFTPHLYDEDEIEFALDNIKDIDVFIDAGANIGFWSLRIAKEKPNVQVVAVEANPRTAEILKKNVGLNQLTNITVVNKGLAAEKGTLSLSCGQHGNRGGDSFKFNHDEGSTISVDVLRLRDLCNVLYIDKIGFIKMDIEGMEYEVLEEFFRGAELNMWPKYICIEMTHDHNILNLLDENGFRLLHSYRENSVFVNANL